MEAMNNNLRSTNEIIWDELRKYFLDPEKDYPEPHFLFDYNGVGFSPIGGIQAISGQKKNGKTFVFAQLMAVVLRTDSKRISEYLPGLSARQSTIEWLGHSPVVLYCDTEMEKLNTAKVLRRVHWLCEWDMKERNERFFVMCLREVPKGETQSANKERWRLIKNAIDQVSPDIVFIDGLRDLVNNFNDNEESAAIVNEMMSIASKRNICIWNVLHMNPRPRNDDESKMRGHLGRELGNKVSDTFISIKKKDPAGNVTFTVKQQDARGKDVEDWNFIVTDDAGDLGIPRIIQPTVLKDASEIITDDVFTLFREMLPKGKSQRWSDIRNKLLEEFHCSKDHAKKIIDIAQKKGVLEPFKIGNGYVYSFNYKDYADNNDFPF